MNYIIILVVALSLLPTQVFEFVKVGGGTFYYGEPFEGSNLKCPPYKYEKSTGPWVALDIADYGTSWQ
jgi:hypothetical protein